MAKKNRTNKRRAANLDVRSDGAVKMFEKTLVNGPLTLVFVKLEGCGPCDRLNEDVWSPLTKLKNRSINLARVDSKVFSKTSLANTPPKFYPTLMVVGKDGKPASFKDKDGNLTHSMPRQDTLSEDKEVLSSLVQNPTVKSIPEMLRANLTRNSPPRLDASFNVVHKSPFVSKESLNNQSETINHQGSRSGTLNNQVSRSGNLNNENPRNNQISRSGTLNNQVSRSGTLNNDNPISETLNNKRSNTPINQMSKQIPSSSPPDIGADLISSKPSTLVKQPARGGRLLHALRGKSSSMKALLRLSEPRHTRRHRK